MVLDDSPLLGVKGLHRTFTMTGGRAREPEYASEIWLCCLWFLQRLNL